MRLLSFFNQVETTLSMLRPEAAGGWSRRANHAASEARCWHPGLGLCLHVRLSDVGEGRTAVLARWIGPTGNVLHEHTHFCGSSFEWQTAADAVAEAMPEGRLISPVEPARKETLSAAAGGATSQADIEALLAGG